MHAMHAGRGASQTQTTDMPKRDGHKVTTSHKSFSFPFLRVRQKLLCTDVIYKFFFCKIPCYFAVIPPSLFFPEKVARREKKDLKLWKPRREERRNICYLVMRTQFLILKVTSNAKGDSFDIKHTDREKDATHTSCIKLSSGGGQSDRSIK